MRISKSTVGLILFAVMVAMAFPALLVDAGLALAGGATVTDWVTARTWREWLLIAAVAIGAAGLPLHFLTYRRGDGRTT